MLLVTWLEFFPFELNFTSTENYKINVSYLMVLTIEMFWPKVVTTKRSGGLGGVEDFY
jgi:hypothetical protein